MDNAEDASDTTEEQASRGNVYQSINISGDARVHLGNNHTHSKDTHQDQLLKSLYSPWLEQRRNAIKDAALNTFDWILEDVHIGNAADSAFDNTHGGPMRARSKPEFVEWLRHGSSTYWISGKPGSGKSTLMSFIVEDDRTRRALEIWSGSRDLEILSFYFWRPGGDLQKSAVGLLQGLLHQLCECLSEDNASVLVQKLRINFGRPPVWTERKLRRAIIAAIQLASNKSFCIFIDGLDEYLGDYYELLDLIEMLADVDNVRCCVSSRPDVQLRERLQACDSLRLQDYNTVDIQEYVRGKFKAARMKSSSNGLLLNAIVWRAEGVFLWAVLVTQTLVRGAACGDSDDSLMQRLDDTPGEINDLFAKMFSAIDKHHKQSLIFYFQALMSQHQASNNFGSICDITACMSSKPGSCLEFEGECSRVEQQILGQSAGLLEIVDALDLDEFGARTWNTEAAWTSGTCKYDLPHLRTAQNQIKGESAKTGQHKRQKMDETAPFPQMLRYESRIPQWIHRCAHDFLFESETTQDIAAVVLEGVGAALRRLCIGRMDYIAMAPSFSLSSDSRTSTEWRLAHLLRSLDRVINEESQTAFELLDHLKVALSYINDEEVRNRPWVELRDSRFDWEGHAIVFWEICARSMEYWEYVLERYKWLALESAGTILHVYMLEQATRDAWKVDRDGDRLNLKNQRRLLKLLGIIKTLALWITRSLRRAHVLASRHPASTKIFHARGSFSYNVEPGMELRSISYHTSLHHLPKSNMDQLEGLMLASLVRAYFLLGRLTDRDTIASVRLDANNVQGGLGSIFRLFHIQCELPVRGVHSTERNRGTFLHATPAWAEKETQSSPSQVVPASEIKEQDPGSMRIVILARPRENGPKESLNYIAENAIVIETNPSLTSMMQLELIGKDHDWPHQKRRRRELLDMILTHEVSQNTSMERDSKFRQQTLTDALAGLSLEDESMSSANVMLQKAQTRAHQDLLGAQRRLKGFERDAAHSRPWPRDPPH